MKRKLTQTTLTTAKIRKTSLPLGSDPEVIDLTELSYLSENEEKKNPSSLETTPVSFLQPLQKKKEADYIQDIRNIHAFPSRRPAFKSQVVYNHSGVFKLDAENSVSIEYNFLSADVLKEYLQSAASVPRVSGKSAYNSVKPRREICYTVDGRSFRYSGILHPTSRYPPHVIQLLPLFQEYIDRVFPQNVFRRISGALDILYSPEFERGGSAGAHSDNELDWGLVLIFSLGQTRYLRVRRKSNGDYFNLEMRHNSAVVMHGKTFQELYTHQVDKLSKDEEVYYRMSLNVRYLEGEHNFHDVIAQLET